MRAAAALMLLSAWAAPPALAAAPESCPAADVDHNCTANVGDVLLAVGCALGLHSSPGCDVDGDGAWNVLDAQAAINAALACGGVDTCVVCGGGAEWLPVGWGWQFATLEAGDGVAIVGLYHPNLPVTVSASVEPHWQFPWAQADSGPWALPDASEPVHVPVWARICSTQCEDDDCAAWWCVAIGEAPPDCDL